MEKVVYKVPAINCMHCVHTIKTELSEMPGVKSVEGDAASKQVTIEFESPANEDSIKKLLEEINYPAVG